MLGRAASLAVLTLGLAAPAIALSDQALTDRCRDDAASDKAALPPPASPSRGPLDGAPIAREQQLACSIGLTAYLAERDTLTVVDVRDRTERRRARIPDARVVSPVEIGSKAFLKGSPIVMVGSGLDDLPLMGRCADLRRAGWDARVLVGGVKTLALANQKLDAPAAELDMLGWLTGADLHRFALASPDRVVVVGGDGSPTLPAMLAMAERWPNSSEAEVAARVANAVRQRPESALAIVTLRAFVLKGGLPAYTTYLDEQRRIAESAYRPLKRPCGAV